MAETAPDADLRDKVNGLNAEVNQISATLSNLVGLVGGITPGPRDMGREERDEAVTVHDAYNKGFTTALQSQRLLVAAGYSDATTAEPELLEVTREARKVAMRMAASRVINEDGEEDDEDVEDRGKGAQAELPPGVPDWPPRPFLARQRVFTKKWQIYLLKQNETVRSDGDPRIAEGDCLSNVVLWLDYATIATRLLEAAVADGDQSAVGPLVSQVVAYQAAAYDAARMRVDDISMTLLNRPAAELYSKTSRMELESTTMRSPGIKFLRKSNAAMLTAKAKAIANKAAAQTGPGTENAGPPRPKPKPKTPVAKPGPGGNNNNPRQNTQQTQTPPASRNTNTTTRPSGAPQTAASSAAETSGRAGAAGGP